MTINDQQAEQFFVPPTILRFLIALTNPINGEAVLNISLNPKILSSSIKEKTQTEPDYINSDPTPEELDQLKQVYDVILCGPTFGASFYQEPGGSGEPNEEFWLKWSVNHLSQNGRMAIIVPTGMLSNHSQQTVRKFLIQKASLQAIVDLPSGWAQHTATQASILFVTADRNPQQNVKMLRFSKADAIPWDNLASYILEDEQILPQKAQGLGFTVSVSQFTNLRLDAQYYDPRYAESSAPDSALFTPIRLADLVDIRSGERFSKDDFSPYGIPFLRVSNIDSNGFLTLHNANTVTPDLAIRSRGYSLSGDLLLTVAGTVGKVAYLDNNILSAGVCIDTSIRRLRVLDATKVLPEYLYLCLCSPNTQKQIKRSISGSVIPTLSIANLGEITIYVPPVSKQQEIIATFKKYTLQQTEKLFSLLYNLDQFQEQNTTTPPLEQNNKKITKTSLEAPQPSWQEIAKTLLPFPIARAFSSFEKSVHQSHSARLKELLNLSEAIVYYLYGVLVADQLQHLKIADADLASKIFSSFTSYSIDRRLEVIFHILKIAKQKPDISLFVPELTNVEVGVCRDIHNNVRNVYDHTNMAEPWCQQKVNTYRPKLEKLLKSLLPLKDYNLAQITKIEIHKRRYMHSIISMMGDNPLFQPQTEEVESLIPAETSHVILISKDYDVLDLHPFYLLHAWESTGMQLHLCFLKQLVGDVPNQRLKIESTQGVGDTLTETDMELNNIVTDGTS